MRLNNFQKSILLEYQRRGLHREKAEVSYRALGFKRQNDYLDSRHKYRYRAALCTRRAGKSLSEAIDHLEVGMQYPHSNMLYGGLTVTSAYDIIWDAFFELDDKYKIGLKEKKSEYKILFPNGSKVKLFGLDASERQIRKQLGQKLRKCSLDECGSVTVDLKKIVMQMIKPALADLRPYSWLSLIGTPENIPNTFFETVTSGNHTDLEWDIHKWTGYENPFVARQWKEEIDEMIANNPLVINASWFKTHYLGQWCTDDELLIFHLKRPRNFVEQLPGDVNLDYVLGVDLGYNDATAFTVMGYNIYHQTCYIVRAFKEAEMDLTQTANIIKNLNSKYPFRKIIVDGANKQGVKEIENRHRIPLYPAEKTDKNTYIRLLDDDYKMGKVKLLEGSTGELETEYISLIWQNEDKQDEDPRCANHLSDSTLYAWRECQHYLNLKIEPKPKRGSEKELEQWILEEERHLINQKKEQEEMGIF